MRGKKECRWSKNGGNDVEDSQFEILFGPVS